MEDRRRLFCFYQYNKEVDSYKGLCDSIHSPVILLRLTFPNILERFHECFHSIKNKSSSFQEPMEASYSLNDVDGKYKKMGAMESFLLVVQYVLYHFENLYPFQIGDSPKKIQYYSITASCKKEVSNLGLVFVFKKNLFQFMKEFHKLKLPPICDRRRTMIMTEFKKLYQKIIEREYDIDLYSELIFQKGNLEAIGCFDVRKYILRFIEKPHFEAKSIAQNPRVTVIRGICMERENLQRPFDRLMDIVMSFRYDVSSFKQRRLQNEELRIFNSFLCSPIFEKGHQYAFQKVFSNPKIKNKS